MKHMIIKIQMKIEFLDYSTYYTVLPNTEDSEEEQRFHGLIGTYQKSPNAIVDGRPVWQHGYRSKTVLSYNSGNGSGTAIHNFAFQFLFRGKSMVPL